MKTTRNFFISYCHADEWLKDELKVHLAGLARQGKVTLWDDRKLIAGQDLDDTVMKNLYDADVVIMLVSSDFINSEYCMSKEFKEAKKLRSEGKLDIAPIIVRHCKWQIDDLDKLVCLPRDAQPVNGEGFDPSQKTKRDKAWTSVVRDIEIMLDDLNKLNSPILRNSTYVNDCRRTVSVKHPNNNNIHIDQIFIDPDLRVNAREEYIETQKSLIKFIKKNRLTFVSGDDACGKTTLFYQCQKSLLLEGLPAIVLKGSEIKNLDIDKKILTEISTQLEPRDYITSRTWIFLDDFESCVLSENLQNKLIDHLVKNYAGVVASSFTSFQSMRMMEADGILAQSIEIVPFSPDKIYQLVFKWEQLSDWANKEDFELAVSEKFQILGQIVGSGGIPTFPSYLINFLEVMETVSAKDISATANASCYDALITVRLLNSNIPSSDIDSYKLFYCYVAYDAYKNYQKNTITPASLDRAYKAFTTEYFDPPSDFLQSSLKSGIMHEENGNYVFSIEFIWYFFVGKYLSSELYKNDVNEFDAEVAICISKIHQKLYANILLFCSYFLADNRLIAALIDCLDTKFEDVGDWKLDYKSQKSMNLSKEVLRLTQNDSDANEARIKALQEENQDIIQNSEKMVEAYLHPFSLNQSRLDDIEETDTFMGQVNSLFRIQSILSQVLSTRSGTFRKDTVILTVEAMVKAAGRFSRLNLSVAEQIIADPDGWILGVREAFPNDDLSTAERSKKLLKIFSFWSVMLSQGGVARLLKEPHAVAALKILHKENELDSDGNLTSDKPFNFSTILCVAELWSSGKIDKVKIEKFTTEYGKDSPFTEMLRFSLFIFSHYNSIDTQTRQWLNSAMNINLKATRFVQRNLPVPTLKNAIGRKRKSKN